MKRRSNKGMILILLYFLIVVLVTAFIAFVSRGIWENKDVFRSKDTLQAYYLAEAGIDEVKRGLYDAFRLVYPQALSNDFTWFDDLDDGDPSGKYDLPSDAVLSTVVNGTYTVTITDVNQPDSSEEDRDITLVCVAAVNSISKTVTSVIRYKLATSSVFDYSYFVNNLGWFWGGGITGQGDIRSNGDFSFGGNPTVNGDIYASANPDLGADGDITGNSRNDSIDFYRSNADSTVRPTNPTAGSDPDVYSYPNGYDGASDRFPQQAVLSMPYLGDLSDYQSLAVSQNGTISQGGVTVVDNVLNDNVVLIGTAANPIVISGPVVVTGDVLIKGVITGQGTIFSGRNTHIIGDITYQNPPAWPKADTAPDATDTQNAARDFLGLASKGNVIIGDYTRNDWQVNVASYLQPPFTQAYEVDLTDSANGYVQYFQGDDPYFNGDYTVNDGGTKLDGSNRRFYESSYNNNYVRSIAEPANQIDQIDAVTYTNHAFAGRVGNFTMNGSLIARDEAIVYNGNITMNYDVRVKYKGDEFYLPRELDLPRTQYVKRD